MKFLLPLCLLALFGASHATEYLDEWKEWKVTFGKKYQTDAEEMARRSIWLANKILVDEHNSLSGESYRLEMNAFADMTSKEFSMFYNGYDLSTGSKSHNSTRYYNGGAIGAPVPSTVDWREKGVVTPVKNQKKCGSCWAFSAVGSLEGQHAIKTGKLVSLSEQNLVDCVSEDKGCKGGLMVDAFKYIEKNGGIDTEESYPYIGKNERCHFKKNDIGATIRGFTKIKKDNCEDLKQAVATIGPISAAMDASHMSLQLYKKGIYDPKKCSSTKLDHGILVVGYGTEDGEDYWLIKNSWGENWGMKGYFKIASKNNLCGICTTASYPLV
jgi:cathepsin L